MITGILTSAIVVLLFLYVRAVFKASRSSNLNFCLEEDNKRLKEQVAFSSQLLSAHEVFWKRFQWKQHDLIQHLGADPKNLTPAKANLLCELSEMLKVLPLPTEPNISAPLMANDHRFSIHCMEVEAAVKKVNDPTFNMLWMERSPIAIFELIRLLVIQRSIPEYNQTIGLNQQGEGCSLPVQVTGWSKKASAGC